MNSEVREEMRLLSKVGWRRIGHTGGDHQAIEHPEYGRWTLPSSPSDHRWRKNQRRDIARLMGRTLRDLEIEMGVASASRTNGARPKRERNVNGVHIHRLKIAGAFQQPEEKPESSPFCEHGIDFDHECFDCGRTFDDLPKFCEHGRSMEEPCGRCHRRPEPPKAPKPTAKQPYPCRQCGATIQPTGKRGRPRVFCGPECEKASKRKGRARRVSVKLPADLYAALGSDPEGQLLALVQEHARSVR